AGSLAGLPLVGAAQTAALERREQPELAVGDPVPAVDQHEKDLLEHLLGVALGELERRQDPLDLAPQATQEVDDRLVVTGAMRWDGHGLAPSPAIRQESTRRNRVEGGP